MNDLFIPHKTYLERCGNVPQICAQRTSAVHLRQIAGLIIILYCFRVNLLT